MSPTIQHDDDLSPITRRATAPDRFLSRPDPQAALTTLYAGKAHKAFRFRTGQLEDASPYLRKMLLESEGHDGVPAPETFENMDEYAMALFQRWLSGEKLGGPNDFHSFQHYLGLYVLARKFEVEGLENEVMDLVRRYYAVEQMTASALRLEYIYTYTSEPNFMRTFLLSTAAYRALCDKECPLSDSIRGVLAKNSEMSLDFIEALMALHQNGLEDVRKEGHECEWHVHEHSEPCPEEPDEAWRSD